MLIPGIYNPKNTTNVNRFCDTKLSKNLQYTEDLKRSAAVQDQSSSSADSKYTHRILLSIFHPKRPNAIYRVSLILHHRFSLCFPECFGVLAVADVVKFVGDRSHHYGDVKRRILLDLHLVCPDCDNDDEDQLEEQEQKQNPNKRHGMTHGELLP